MRAGIVKEMKAHLGEVEMPYILKRSPKRKSVGLRIDGGGLTVSIPQRMPEKTLDGILEDKASWILKKLEEFKRRKMPVQKFGNGESLPFLGEKYVLCLCHATKPHVEIRDETVHVALKEHENPKKGEAVLTKWYKREALLCFSERVEYFSEKLGKAPSRIFLSSAKTRWGSCNSRGEIRLNWRLIKMPLGIIDYVIAHELCHLVHMNHSPAFWAQVEALYPDCKKARMALKGHL